MKIKSNYFPDHFTWSQKLYHYLKDDLTFELGICPICGSRCKYRGINFGYSNYCSRSCLNKSDEHKNKVKNTINTKYGNRGEFYKRRHEKYETTCRKKYGVKNVSQLDTVKFKKEQTTLSHFGVKHTLESKELRKKYENTCLEKYGSKNGGCSKQAIEKIRLTRKKNHSENTSSLEEYFNNYLISNNIKFERQYKCERYPYCCDFYLPNCDVFIEIQGNWTHGFHPFNENDEKDISRLNKLKEKSKQSDYYLSAIDIWVNKDVTKRLTAKENNLNLIEIFAKNINELKKHIIKIKDRLK